MSQESKVEGSASAEKSGPSEVTKGSIRQKIWTYIKENDLATFPRDVKDRIPNYKGSDEAAVRASEVDVFKNANVIEVNPDKPQQNARFLTLEANKTLLVPSTRLKTGLFNQIIPPEDAKKEQLKLCSTTRGVREHSKPVGLDSKMKVDLVITGCVAVSREGFRLGKGEGYADLEFGMMMSMGSVNQDTVVVSTVHDCQVVDIPESLMQPNDVGVDIIVTPTEVIYCSNKRPKPTGIYWNLLTPEKLNRCPILKKLRLIHQKEGKDVRIKDEETAPTLEELEEAAQKVDEMEEDGGGDNNRGGYRRRYFRRYQRRPRRPRSQGHSEGDEEKGSASENEGGDKRPRQRRRQNRRRRPQTDEEGGADNDDGGSGDGEKKKGRPQRNRRRQPRRFPPRRKRSQDGSQEGDSEGGEGHDGPRFSKGRTSSVYIGGIPKSLRVSELKQRVKDKDVKPLQVIWHGRNGHAFLVFPKEKEADEALHNLIDLSYNDTKLKVQLSKRTQNRRKMTDEDVCNADSNKEDNADD